MLEHIAFMCVFTKEREMGSNFENMRILIIWSLNDLMILMT